jgi:hypothetical protein
MVTAFVTDPLTANQRASITALYTATPRLVLRTTSQTHSLLNKAGWPTRRGHQPGRRLQRRHPPATRHSSARPIMQPALPASDYYDGSAPCPIRSTDGGPSPNAPVGCGRRSGGTGKVPVFTDRSLGEGGTRLYPRGIATATPQHFTVASRTG